MPLSHLRMVIFPRETIGSRTTSPEAYRNRRGYPMLPSQIARLRDLCNDVLAPVIDRADRDAIIVRTERYPPSFVSVLLEHLPQHVSDKLHRSRIVIEH